MTRRWSTKTEKLVVLKLLLAAGSFFGSVMLSPALLTCRVDLAVACLCNNYNSLHLSTLQLQLFLHSNKC
jgi:hypothetical protein